jgi:hypothetical protein
MGLCPLGHPEVGDDRVAHEGVVEGKPRVSEVKDSRRHREGQVVAHLLYRPVERHREHGRGEPFTQDSGGGDRGASRLRQSPVGRHENSAPGRALGEGGRQIVSGRRHELGGEAADVEGVATGPADEVVGVRGPSSRVRIAFQPCCYGLDGETGQRDVQRVRPAQQLWQRATECGLTQTVMTRRPDEEHPKRGDLMK